MHLARQADGLNILRANRCPGQSASNGPARGRPPVFGILLGPACARRGERFVFGRGSRTNRPGSVGQHGTAAAGPNVDAEQHVSGKTAALL